MIGLIVSLVVGIPMFYACSLATIAYARRVAARHNTGQVYVTGTLIVNERHCFWCAFWVNAARGISGGAG